ncbi:axoneme-associated protein mst101(2) [Toxotes jaculatrix]|uniref:axoneme-associated protein mst101(2) n=1 Tax=Toxotes jaculatrix TaxID=941984 RepID=UPI001B3AE053|nr:axoneme-associated protein mst101(2) [Toxotes jaculatrix]
MSLADQQWCPTSVQVTVLQARGLRIKGKSGTNDAYAVMQVGKEKYQTSVAEKSVAPVWKEEAAFDLPHQGGGGGERGTLHVHVLHRALVGPDKLLGQAVINLLQLSEDKTRNKTEWFKLLDKTGKADKDRGEVLLDIQFMRNNMTASMFDLSAAGKSRSRLGKFKDKVRGKKKESDTVSSVVPSFTQVLTDSEEEANGDAELAAGKDEKKKKHKIKSLFSPKSNLQKNMSQSMSVLPAKNSSLSGSQSSGLNVDSSEGKKKFKFMIHKRSGSSDNKDSFSGHQKHGPVEQSNLCINGSHVYCEEPQPRTSRIGSNFSLASSGHGSMEDVPESSPPSVASLRAHERLAEEKRQEEQERRKIEEEEERKRKEEERIRAEEDRAQEERRRQEEEERKRAEEEEKVRWEEEERTRKEEERKRREEEERVRKEEERERLAEEKRRLEKEERRKNEEEEKRKREEEERIRAEEERAQEERRRQEEEERARRQEEERKLAEQKREEEERRIEEEKVRKQEEEKIRREEERRRKVEEERMRRQEEEYEEKRRLEEQERKLQEEERKKQEEEEREEKRQREEEERIRVEEERAQEERRRQEEEERDRKEKEEHERLVKEKRKLEEKEKERIEAEEKIRREEEERIRLEEERKKVQEAEKIRREEEECQEKRRLEEQERRRVEEEEKRQREEQERIKKEEERRQEEENRARKEKEEYERLVEEKRRLEKQERRQKEEEERIKNEEQERIRIEEEKRRRQEEEENAKKEKEEMERLRKEKEARKLENEKLTTDAEEWKKRENKAKDGHKAAWQKSTVAVGSPAEVPSTNPFDEDFSNNPFEEIPNSPAGPDSSRAKGSNVQPGCQFAVSSMGSKTISTAEKDLISAQREKRPAPQPPGRNQAESQREQDASIRHLAQINKQNNEKGIVKTASVLPQRSVQVNAPQSQSHTETKNTKGLMQISTTKETESVAKHSKRPAPPRPRSVEEEPSPQPKTPSSFAGNISQGCGSEQKQIPVVYGLNPFEDDEDENELTAQDDTTTPGSTGTAHWPAAVSLATDKDATSQAKVKSSKVAHAPPPPAKTAAASRSLIHQKTDRSHAMGDTGVAVPNKGANQACDPQPEATIAVPVQEASLKEPQPAIAQRTREEASMNKEVPPTTSRRLQPVKPLNPLEQQSVSIVQGEKHKSTGVLSEVQEKPKGNDSRAKGPYSQLTREELISLVLKQENQLSEKDKKISELEQYIDNLLVRVIEEKPSILMSMSSLKKAV